MAVSFHFCQGKLLKKKKLFVLRCSLETFYGSVGTVIIFFGRNIN